MRRKIVSIMFQRGRFLLLCRLGLASLLFVGLSLSAQAENDSARKSTDTGAVVHSIKKGAGITPNRHKDWQQRLGGLNVAWFYTWRPQHPGDVYGSIEFVPMLWGKNAVSEETLADLKGGMIKGQYKHLLGFNEPDAKSQSNLPVEEATKLWPNVVATGLRLGSPATVNANNLWMQNFVSSIENKGERLDFIAVHWYGGANSEKFLKYLEHVHQRYGRPIWITEFAVADWDAKKRGFSRYSQAQTLSFMKAVIPALEKIDYIERYAWFSAEPGHLALGQSVLFDGEGNLTRLGQAYAGY